MEPLRCYNDVSEICGCSGRPSDNVIIIQDLLNMVEIYTSMILDSFVRDHCGLSGLTSRI